MQLRSRAIAGSSIAIACLALSCHRSDAATTDDAGADAQSRVSADAATVYDGPRSTCSTGPAYTISTQFAIEDCPPHCHATQPECVPRCDYSRGKYMAEYWMDALPSGSCLYEGERCSMGAWELCDVCNGLPSPGALNGYECACTAGEWRCIITAKGGSTCTSCADR